MCELFTYYKNINSIKLKTVARRSILVLTPLILIVSTSLSTQVAYASSTLPTSRITIESTPGGRPEFALGAIVDQVINADGTVIIPQLPIQSLQGLSWSPDGSKILYSYPTPNAPTQRNQDLYIANSNGSNPQVVSSTTNNDTNDYNGKWSPRGDKILWSDQWGQSYVSDPNGLNMRSLGPLTTDTRAFNPTFSPDGTKIAYALSLPINIHDTPACNMSQLHIQNVDGSNDHKVFSFCQGANYPEWSSDGTKLSFTGSYFDTSTWVNGTYIANVDGSSMHLIAPNRSQYSTSIIAGGSAPWSPDGNWLLVHSYNSALNFQYKDDLALLSVDGTTLYPIPNPNGDKRWAGYWDTPNATDQVLPTISSSLTPAPNSHGWNNSDTTVSFDCNDADSGIASCSAPTTLTTEGANQQVMGTAEDNGGNTATTTAHVSIDKTAPTINYSVSAPPNSNNWNSSDVTVTFNCTDALSGIESCTSPVTVSSEGGNQEVTGTAMDKAGNTKSVTAVINLDKTAPNISFSLSSPPNAAGWHKGDVTVTFNCSDSVSGIAICPMQFTLNQEGAGQIVQGTAMDNAGNISTVSTTINIDKSPPAVSNLTWSANPLQQGQNTTLSVNASDGLSGLSSVQYSINGGTPQAMAYDTATNTWKVSFGSNLPANTYDIAVTATDAAGNTSPLTSDILAIYNSANGYVTGHAKIAPTTSDTLPINLDSSNNPAKLILGFTNVTAPTSGSFDLKYSVKNNFNEFSLSSTSITWSVVQDSTHASMLGRADMTVYVNGVKTVTQDVSVRYDIVLGANGAADHVSVKIYNPSLNPNTDSPTYSINDDVVMNGSNLMIRP